VAKQEHARLSERVVAGLRRAKREGKTLGRKRIIVDRSKIRGMHASGDSVRVIAGKIGISKSLVANILNIDYTVAFMSRGTHEIVPVYSRHKKFAQRRVCSPSDPMLFRSDRTRGAV